MQIHGLGTMIGIALRTGWRGLVGWILGVVALMAITASSITSLYNTPAKLRSYAESVTGGALYLLNGRVAGLDTLGGVLANEFGFVVAFALPLMAVALTVRSTRRDEAAGRLELLLAAAVGRHAPILAAVLVAAIAVLLTGLGCAVVMILAGASPSGSLLYGIGVAGLGWVFVGVAAVAAQVVEHPRTVWGIGLALIVVSYLVRGVGAMRDGVMTWFSPHGWLDGAAAFGNPRSAPLVALLVLAVALVVLAFRLSTRRDVGSALLQPQGSRPRASGFLRTPLGVAWHDHRGAILGWTIGAGVLMGTYGSLSQEVLDAIEGNPDLGGMLGADAGAAAEQLLATVSSTFLMMLAMVVAAFSIMAVGSLHGEEETGRLEAQLSGDRSRWSWLAVHTAVALAGIALVGVVGAVALAGSTVASTGQRRWWGDILSAASGYLPAALVFGGLTIAIFGAASKIRGLAWGLFALAAVLAYLGPGLGLSEQVVRASPFQAAGTDLVGGAADATAIGVLLALAVALTIIGFVGFRARDVPRG